MGFTYKTIVRVILQTTHPQKLNEQRMFLVTIAKTLIITHVMIGWEVQE
jgi:hypothetical protein